MSRIPIRFIITVVVLGLLITACCLPTFWAKGGFFEGGTEFRGIQLLIFGPILCPMTLPWLANVALLNAIWHMWKNQTGKMLAASCFAVLLALMPIMRVGEEGPILKEGYWFWLSSMVASFIAATGLRVFSAKPQVAVDSTNIMPDPVPDLDGANM